MMDQVNWDDDERLDIVDLLRLQSFVSEGLASGVGGTLSIGSGTFTQITINSSTLTAVTIGPCQLYDATPVDDGDRILGRVLAHDPSIPEQAVLSTVDFSPWVDQNPWLWARRVQVDTDLESRIKWLAGETSFNLLTIQRELVEWHLGLEAPPASPDGWFRVAYLLNWPVTGPFLIWIHPFDAALGYDGTGDALLNGVAALWEQSDAIYFSGGGVLGVGKVLANLAAAVARLRDSEAPADEFWFNPPKLGARQADDRLTALEEVQATTSTKGLLLVHGPVIFDGLYKTSELEWYTAPEGQVSATLQGVGTVVISHPGKAHAITATAIQTTDPPNKEVNVTVGLPDYDSVSKTSTFTVWLYDTGASVAVDSSFTLLVHGEPNPGS